MLRKSIVRLRAKGESGYSKLERRTGKQLKG